MPHWIFDLDNTLHDAEPLIFPEINRQMLAYIMHHLDLDEATADGLRGGYWVRYGATLSGLLRHHPEIDAEHFLRETHRLSHLMHLLRPMRGLYPTLRALPGRKILFTNGPRQYAQDILRKLGIVAMFDNVVAIQQAGFLPKPHAQGYRRILTRHRLAPEDCIMVEDTSANLATAKRLGMRTILIGRQRRGDAMADLHVASLPELLRQVRARGWLAPRA